MHDHEKHNMADALLNNFTGALQDSQETRRRKEVDAPEVERVCLLLEEVSSGVAPTASLEARNKIRFSIHAVIEELLRYKR